MIWSIAFNISSESVMVFVFILYLLSLEINFKAESSSRLKPAIKILRYCPVGTSDNSPAPKLKIDLPGNGIKSLFIFSPVGTAEPLPSVAPTGLVKTRQ